jgi:sugar phosphate isomerase/epimerase
MKPGIVISLQNTSFASVAFQGREEWCLERIARMGYRGIELAVRNPDQVDVRAVYRRATDLGLTVIALGTGQTYVDEQISLTDPHPRVRNLAVARLKSHIEVAAEISAQVIIGCVRGKSGKDLEQTQVCEWLMQGMAELSDFALRMNPRVYLTIEPLNRYETNLINTVSQAMDFIRCLDRQNLRILFDLFHANIEEKNVIQSLQEAMSRLSLMHIADSNRQAPGQGHINFLELLDLLRASRYEGFLSLEALPLPSPEACAEQFMTFFHNHVEIQESGEMKEKKLK